DLSRRRPRIAPCVAATIERQWGTEPGDSCQAGWRGRFARPVDETVHDFAMLLTWMLRCKRAALGPTLRLDRRARTQGDDGARPVRCNRPLLPRDPVEAHDHIDAIPGTGDDAAAADRERLCPVLIVRPFLVRDAHRLDCRRVDAPRRGADVAA